VAFDAIGIDFVELPPVIHRAIRNEAIVRVQTPPQPSSFNLPVPSMRGTAQMRRRQTCFRRFIALGMTVLHAPGGHRETSSVEIEWLQARKLSRCLAQDFPPMIGRQPGSGNPLRLKCHSADGSAVSLHRPRPIVPKRCETANGKEAPRSEMAAEAAIDGATLSRAFEGGR
jgi:hypothetical protein